ncbi:flavin reductase family protein [Aliiglaciecola litoralis]|uniref:Flavin reductase n=1 Tax=Aliiglaciecola litoralis TaxID=582857 RepID=A0ABN1LQ65_9ALTE
MKYTVTDIHNMDSRFRAQFVNSLSGFKSAHLVGTQSNQQVHNVAIVNSVFHLGADPALLGMIMRPHTVRRDTLENIVETGVYTLNHINSEIIAAAHQTSARYDQELSEFNECGLTPYFSDTHNAPYVAQSRVKIGMALEEVVHLAVNQTNMVIGRIVEVILDDNAVLEDGFVDLQALDSVCIASLDGYYQPSLLARFEYAKPGVVPQKKR